MMLTSHPVASRWRFLLGAAICMAMLHIIATLAAPSLTQDSAFKRLARQLPANTMRVLPWTTPETQPLPYLGADARYAICRFDISRAPVSVSATLPDVGWTLAIYSDEGDNIYAATGTQGQKTELSLVLVTSDERFMGLTPEARGRSANRQASLSVPSRNGLAVVRAPDRGQAFKAQTEASLKLANCGPHTQQ